MNYKTTGIILRNQPIFESDRRLVIFSFDHGKSTVLAKSATKNALKYGGKLECGNEVALVLHKGKGMEYLNQCDLLTYPKHIRTDYNFLCTALYFLDIVFHTTSDFQKNPALYQLLKAGLNALNTAANTPTNTTATSSNSPVPNASNQSKQTHLQHIIHTFQHAYLDCEGLKSPNQHINTEQFQELVYHYSGKLVIQPSFIPTVSV